ncbi:MAG: hypothetical protein SAL07_23690, partial [Oscillatoria sp. PMC 1051.18]|nr:hypothetical protein [Oscillatoria sp. PMC 1050.18]MEC5032916.1 hypothetical protein [Oscillatoria sp. PMC 1051.18]
MVFTTLTQHSHKENLTWKEVTKSEPCPCCGKPDWCSVGKDGRGEILAILCNRDAQPPNNDWVEVKRSKEDHPIYSLRNDNYLPQPLRKTKPRKKTRKQQRPAPLPEKIELARLPEPGKPPEVNHKPFIPNWLSEQGIPDSATEQRFSYSETQWVSRFQWADPTKPKGYAKTFRQGHIKPDGTTKWGKGSDEWLPYRFDDVLKYAQNQAVFFGEGEQVVEALRLLGLPAITLQGSSWRDIDLEVLAVLLMEVGTIPIFCPDNDDTGQKKAKAVEKAAAKHGLPCVIIDPTRLWAEMPSKGDVVDWIEG